MFRRKPVSVGLIGLGIIGTRIASHLRTAGFAVSVWNRTPKPEPNFLGSPAEVAAAADIIQLFVADGAAVEEVLAAIGDGLTSRHTVICSATIGRAATLEMARLVRERGARFLDAPFTGTKGAADKGQLVYYIGDDDETFAIAKPVLEASSKAIVPIGKVGDAALLKVVTNVLGAAAIETLAEALAIVKAAGIAPDALPRALEHHGVRSPLMDLKLPALIEGNYDTHFSLKHMLKDVRFGLELGAQLKLELPVTSATANAMCQGIEQGWGDLDFACMMKRYS